MEKEPIGSIVYKTFVPESFSIGLDDDIDNEPTVLLHIGNEAIRFKKEDARLLGLSLLGASEAVNMLLAKSREERLAHKEKRSKSITRN